MDFMLVKIVSAVVGLTVLLFGGKEVVSNYRKGPKVPLTLGEHGGLQILPNLADRQAASQFSKPSVLPHPPLFNVYVREIIPDNVDITPTQSTTSGTSSVAHSPSNIFTNPLLIGLLLLVFILMCTYRCRHYHRRYSRERAKLTQKKYSQKITNHVSETPSEKTTDGTLVVEPARSRETAINNQIEKSTLADSVALDDKPMNAGSQAEEIELLQSQRMVDHLRIEELTNRLQQANSEDGLTSELLEMGAARKRRRAERRKEQPDFPAAGQVDHVGADTSHLLRSTGQVKPRRKMRHMLDVKGGLIKLRGRDFAEERRKLEDGNQRLQFERKEFEAECRETQREDRRRAKELEQGEASLRVRIETATKSFREDICKLEKCLSELDATAEKDKRALNKTIVELGIAQSRQIRELENTHQIKSGELRRDLGLTQKRFRLSDARLAEERVNRTAAMQEIGRLRKSNLDLESRVRSFENENAILAQTSKAQAEKLQELHKCEYQTVYEEQRMRAQDREEALQTRIHDPESDEVSMKQDAQGLQDQVRVSQHVPKQGARDTQDSTTRSEIQAGLQQNEPASEDLFNAIQENSPRNDNTLSDNIEEPESQTHKVSLTLNAEQHENYPINNAEANTKQSSTSGNVQQHSETTPFDNESSVALRYQDVNEQAISDKESDHDEVYPVISSTVYSSKNSQSGVEDNTPLAASIHTPPTSSADWTVSDLSDMMVKMTISSQSNIEAGLKEAAVEPATVAKAGNGYERPQSGGWIPRPQSSTLTTSATREMAATSTADNQPRATLERAPKSTSPPRDEEMNLKGNLVEPVQDMEPMSVVQAGFEVDENNGMHNRSDADTDWTQDGTSRQLLEDNRDGDMEDVSADHELVEHADGMEEDSLSETEVDNMIYDYAVEDGEQMKQDDDREEETKDDNSSRMSPGTLAYNDYLSGMGYTPAESVDGIMDEEEDNPAVPEANQSHSNFYPEPSPFSRVGHPYFQAEQKPYPQGPPVGNPYSTSSSPAYTKVGGVRGNFRILPGLGSDIYQASSPTEILPQSTVPARMAGPSTIPVLGTLRKTVGLGESSKSSDDENKSSVPKSARKRAPPLDLSLVYPALRDIGQHFQTQTNCRPTLAAVDPPIASAVIDATASNVGENVYSEERRDQNEGDGTSGRMAEGPRSVVNDPEPSQDRSFPHPQTQVPRPAGPATENVSMNTKLKRKADDNLDDRETKKEKA